MYFTRGRYHFPSFLCYHSGEMLSSRKPALLRIFYIDPGPFCQDRKSVQKNVPAGKKLPAGIGLSKIFILLLNGAVMYISLKAFSLKYFKC